MKYSYVVPFAVIAAATTPAFAVQYLSIEEAQRVMFPEATEFKDTPLQLNSEQMQQIQDLSKLPARSAKWRMYSAFAGEKSLGYIILDDVIGKFELISYAVALNSDASIKQIEILNYRESHGFEIRNPAWRRQFVGKSIKTNIAIGGDIANISGATLSCSHVTDGIRRITAIAQIAIKK